MDAKTAIAAIDDVLSSTVNYDESLEYQLTSYDIDWLEEAKKALQSQDDKKGFCNLLGKCLVYSDNLDDYNEMKKGLEYAGAKKIAEMLKSQIIEDSAYGCDSNQYSGYYDYTIKMSDIPEYIEDVLKLMEGQYGI